MGGLSPCRSEGTARVDVIGIRCYSSDDLANWEDEGGCIMPMLESATRHFEHSTRSTMPHFKRINALRCYISGRA